jgi:long-chain acyl-CoA synthetase
MLGAVAEPIVRSGATERSHAEVFERAARGAGALRAMGIAPGERVALVLRNETRFVEVSFAIGMAGCAPVPINSHWTAAEVAHVIADSSSRAIVAHADLVEVAERAAPGVPIVEIAPAPELVDAFGLDRRASGRHVEYEAWLAGASAPDELAAGAPMSVIYTSGTTGAPKGVSRSPTPPERAPDLLALLTSGLALGPESRTLVPAPLYHTAPNVHVLFAVRLGCEVTIMPRFDPEALLALVERHRIEHIQMVPTMFSRLLALPPEVRERYDLSSLRAVVHAAAPCPPDVKRAMIDWWGPIVHEYYGGTETGIVVTADSEQWLAHPGTVGYPTMDAAVRILDPEGREVAVGEEGEVFLRPPSCWPQFTYIGLPDKRAEIEREGFLTIGDIGRVDADGFLYLTDRANDMIIAGGVNIYPVEIEQCIARLPQVADAAVFGVPDADLGEAVAAHVQLAEGATLAGDAVRDHVARHLAAYKVPRIVVFEALPREDTGKLFKRRLRERYART